MANDLLRDDRALLDRFRQGERAALERVFNQYEGLVRAISLQGFGTFRGFRDVHDVDDAVASSFVAAFSEKARLSYDGLQPYRHFIEGITRNTIRYMLRKRGVVVCEPMETDSLDWVSPEDQVEAAEGPEIVQRFKALLGDRELVEVFELYFGAGLPEQALADNLGISRHKARRMLSKVRTRIKTFLRQEGL